MRQFATAMVLWVLAGCSVAQVAPTAAETARYTGLLAAAARGDAAEIGKLVGAGANVNVRDDYGRTSLHVATFDRRRDAIGHRIGK